MAEAAEAVARLRLDATGFDKQANASFREFSKQLTSVKDATDAAMRGAEALQKVFVKSLGGTIAIGAANALGDAMRDVGAKIGAAGQIAADAQAGMKGLAQSFEEGATRAEKLNAAASGVVKAMEELKNASPVNAAIFKMFGGEQTLTDLEQSMRGAADAELMAGAINARNRAKQTAGMTPEQLRDFDLQAAREAELSAARRIQDEGMRNRTVRALQDRFATEDVEAQDRFFRENDPDRRVAKAGFDGDLYDLQRDRARERMRADFQAGLKEAQRQAEEMGRARKAEEMNLNTMQIVEAGKALADAEEKKKKIDREVLKTEAVVATIVTGMYGSSRGPGQRKTSTEIGIEKRVERAKQERQRQKSQEYMDQLEGEIIREKYQKEFGTDITPEYDSMGNLLTPEQTAAAWAKNMKQHGKGVSNYEKNKALEKKRIRDAEAEADAPFDAAQAAKDQQAKILEYMQQVREVLNELKAYAHVT